jgi:hypothetical protein
MRSGVIVVYQSRDLKDWSPVLPEEVPAWVKEPEVMAMLVDGHAGREGEDGLWYRAEKVADCAIEVKERKLLAWAPRLEVAS